MQIARKLKFSFIYSDEDKLYPYKSIGFFLSKCITQLPVDHPPHIGKLIFVHPSFPSARTSSS